MRLYEKLTNMNCNSNNFIFHLLEIGELFIEVEDAPELYSLNISMVLA